MDFNPDNFKLNVVDVSLDRFARNGFFEWLNLICDELINKLSNKDILDKYNLNIKEYNELNNNKLFNKLRDNIDNKIKDLDSNKFLDLKENIIYDTWLNNIFNEYRNYTNPQKIEAFKILSRNIIDKNKENNSLTIKANNNSSKSSIGLKIYMREEEDKDIIDL